MAQFRFWPPPLFHRERPSRLWLELRDAEPIPHGTGCAHLHTAEAGVWGLSRAFALCRVPARFYRALAQPRQAGARHGPAFRRLRAPTSWPFPGAPTARGWGQRGALGISERGNQFARG